MLRIKGQPFAILQLNVPALYEALVIGVTNQLPKLVWQRMEKIGDLISGGIGPDTRQRDLPR
ncbi:hypothetical protein [Burkholderia metallica]|uniref:Uncharacterized protein n=1 Tax=Burkholderia metallica TaxID=488729 RepID=A0ABT8P3K8_9BURK|nr:hypothetical protein [Burkholderia metallica]AOJ35410.1 hypothetical protein WJ16_28225 [Burkholderia metallica]MCA7999689.1 hypothetical protein [Burkholderia metallica]MDN7929671.1 hypothetical protein [Burkholderia metallica]